MRKNIFSGFIIMSLIAISILAGTSFTKTRADEPQGAGGPIFQKLDEILRNQKAIMESLESMKSELNIIKIRITQQQ